MIAMSSEAVQTAADCYPFANKTQNIGFKQLTVQTVDQFKWIHNVVLSEKCTQGSQVLIETKISNVVKLLIDNSLQIKSACGSKGETHTPPTFKTMSHLSPSLSNFLVFGAACLPKKNKQLPTGPSHCSGQALQYTCAMKNGA